LEAQGEDDTTRETMRVEDEDFQTV
jgi:hypothetical protein